MQRHIYGKWACRCCQCLVQLPALPQVIDGGRSAAALVAHTLISLAALVLHADETPAAMLDPGAGKTRRAYVLAYARGAFDTVPGVI